MSKYIIVIVLISFLVVTVFAIKRLFVLLIRFREKLRQLNYLKSERIGPLAVAVLAIKRRVRDKIRPLIYRNNELINLTSEMSMRLQLCDPALQYVDSMRRRAIRSQNLGMYGAESYRERNVIFLHNSYYHFYFLAKALRKRGWDAFCISYEDPINGPHKNYYHGEDMNVFHKDPNIFNARIRALFDVAKHRYDLMHFSGDGNLSFFPENWYKDDPDDINEWKRLGKKIAYTISGCKSCVSQSSYAAWSAIDGGKSACDSCCWQSNPAVCCDASNLAWGRKVNHYCDIIFAETAPALDYLDDEKTVFDPGTMCLDSDFWRPDLPIPNEFKIVRNTGELLVFHAVGNFELRTKKDGRNIKGTPAVVAAIDSLQSEGIKVRLVFATNMKNTEVRYLQAQADVIVDQLISGCYGAIAREGMMLGKPVIGYVNRKETNTSRVMTWRQEIPIVSACERTVRDELKKLLLDSNLREKIGQKSREYAIKWHGADACAERYEKITDALIYTGSRVRNVLELSQSDSIK